MVAKSNTWRLQARITEVTMHAKDRISDVRRHRAIHMVRRAWEHSNNTQQVVQLTRLVRTRRLGNPR